jgi:hypothetical protein
MPLSCFEAAMHYHAKGWSPIALHGPKQGGKKPLYEWKAAQDKPLPVGVLETHFLANPQANVGLCMGPASGLIGLDVDGPEGEALLVQLSGGELPHTTEFTTPNGGRRLLYKLDGEHDPPSRSYKGTSGKEALRIMGRGTQTVMPPSKLEVGGEERPYEWRDGHKVNPAPWPSWLKDLTAQPALPTTAVTFSFPPPMTAAGWDGVQRARAYLDACEPAVSHQGGHPRTFKMANKLVSGFDLDRETALALLMEWNQRCQPPWSLKELEHKVDDALKQKANPGYLLNQPKVSPYMNGQPHPNGSAPPPQPPAEKEVASVQLSKVQKKPIEWLWPYYIPLGKLSVLDGDPGLGKSTIMLDLAARVSTSGIMPNDRDGVSGSVVILSAEDDAEDTIVPRAEYAGADLGKLHIVDEVGGEPPVFPLHIPFIEAFLKKVDARLLLIDPLTAFLGADTRSDQEIRKVLHPIKKMAGRRRCTVFYLRHLNKSAGTKALYRGGGSIAIIGQARSGLIVGKDPDNENVFVLAHNKWNLSGRQKSLRYVLTPNTEGICKVDWQGECDLTSDDLVQPPMSEEDKDEAQVERTKAEEAEVWLRDVLSSQPLPAAEVKRAASEQGITARTLERAKVAIGARHAKLEGIWVWHL